MKHYVLIHNLIMMTRANITNSVEGFKPGDLAPVRKNLITMIEDSYTLDFLTKYQRDRLMKMMYELLD